MNSEGRANATLQTRGYQLGGARIVLAAWCISGLLGCSQDEATPPVPVDPPNRSGDTAEVDDSSDGSEQGGSDNDGDVGNQGGSDGGGDSNQGGNSQSAASSSEGGSTRSTSSTSSQGSTGTTPAGVSSCIAGVDTGHACDPEIDTAICERSTRSCACSDESTWTCSPKGAMSSGSSAFGQ
jgi:hypothetical protein